MTITRDNYLEILDGVCREVIAGEAERTDRGARFPERSIAALRKAGLLGAVSAESVGGLELGPGGAVAIVRRVAQECASTAMVVCMHFAGTAVLEKHGAEEVRRAAASGEHLSTLAFSEAGSRSHFWAPVSTARQDGDDVVLDARKSWVTSASQATGYVWSSKPVDADGASTIWLVPASADGLAITGTFDGLGLRGNDSSPVRADGVRIPASNRLGEDGGGFDVMMSVVLPIFNLMNAACSVGIMEAAVARTADHVGGTRYEHLDSRLADLPTIRNYLARMKCKTDMAATLLEDAAAAVAGEREDAMLRVLESKAAAGEAATEVLDTAMRVCGGSAFRKDVGVERYFRDSRAASVMAPTTDVLYDFIGKALAGMPLF